MQQMLEITIVRRAIKRSTCFVGLLMLAFVGSAYPDECPVNPQTATVQFTLEGITTDAGNVFFNVPTAGTLKLSLDENGTIDATLTAFEAISGFGFNGPSQDTSVSDFSHSGPFSSSWINWFGDYNSGFLVCIPPASCNASDPIGSFYTSYGFTIGVPGEFTSVTDIANSTSGALTEFWLLTSDGNQEQQFGGNIVPEPSTEVMFLSGMGALAGLKILSKKSALEIC